jgi:hypothetical protein
MKKMVKHVMCTSLNLESLIYQWIFSFVFLPILVLKQNVLCQSTIVGKLYNKIVNKVVWGFDYLTGWVMDYTKYNQMKENIY